MAYTGFQIGQTVAVRVAPNRSGAVIEILPPVGGSTRYRIFHGPNDIVVYIEDQLIPVEACGVGELGSAADAARWLSPVVFQARLTAARLAHPQIDNLYAMQAARIEFIPFQLKPLLRFLHSDRPRLLIADEVGVGKTIEAGLILKELETRQEVRNVLIVCPKALVSKWRAEMRRFDEEFRPLDAGDLRYCLDETNLDGGEWPMEFSRAIANLELLRTGAYLEGSDGRRFHPGLLTLDPPPHFDLVIVDEAHHLRNPETNTYKLAETLSDVSEALLFLSATPVHVVSSNLFNLLHLLRPDLFPDESTFDEVLEPNRYITEAMRLLRRRPAADWQRDAARALDRAAQTRWGKAALAPDPRWIHWRNRLAAGGVHADDERIRCLRDLEEFHSLANVMNRTRRRDIDRFTIREPRTVQVPFTPEGEELYHALVALRRDILGLSFDQAVVKLISDTLERQAASCLPALVPVMDRYLSVGSLRPTDVSDALAEEDDDLAITLPASLATQIAEVRALAGALPPEDPKFDRLLDIVGATEAEDGPGKVLVFSYFLHTLDYLRRRLDETDCRVGLVTGAIPDEERECLRDRFRLPREDPDAIDVLLSSEVGCEGLDYEFCDRLVNYDIPWNPMRVEQRIGRIDRWGQRAEKVFIYNFITPGTVEERIYFRCFDRLGIFRDAVGDLEEVLGDLVEGLNQTVSDRNLTAEQAEEKANQLADNALRYLEEQHRLEEENGTILGLGAAYLDDVTELLNDGRVVSPSDICNMIAAFLADPAIDGKIACDPKNPTVWRLALRKEARIELYDRLRALRRTDRPTATFQKWLQGSEAAYAHTYDQKTALERRSLPFITPVHPLAKLAIEHWASRTEPLVSYLTVQDAGLPCGRYAFVCEMWEALAAKPELRLVGQAYDLAHQRIEPEVSSQLLRLLSAAGQEHKTPQIAIEEPAVWGALDEAMHEARLAELAELRERNAAIVDRKLASLEAYYSNRLARIRESLDAAQNERIIRMRRAEQSRVSRDLEAKRKEIAARRDADIVARLVAAGIVEVRHGE